MRIRTIALLLTVAALWGCGENEETDENGSGTLGPPQDVRALSLNAGAVRLDWTAAHGASDSTFRGYVITWGTSSDTVSKSVLTYTADSLQPGETLFTLFSVKTDGTPSTPATIRWAPAARFDTPFTIVEYTNATPSAIAGFDVGTSNLPPSTLPIDQAAQATMDLYLFGGNGSTGLVLRSANLFSGTWNQTKFSTVTGKGPSLDVPLTAFPAIGTFTLDEVTVVDSAIFYVRVIGNNASALHFARIHVHVRAGSTPRAVDLRVSLQRLTGLMYADASPSRRRTIGSL